MLSASINAQGGNAARAHAPIVPAGDSGVVASLSTGLRAPLTVTFESGDAAIAFGSSGSLVTVSLASPLEYGDTFSAVAMAVQEDFAGVLLPVTISRPGTRVPYNQNSVDTFSGERGWTGVWGAANSGLTQGVDFDCYITYPPGTFDGSRLIADMPVTGVPADGVYGFPQWFWSPGSNPAIADLTTLWNYYEWSYEGTGNFNALFECMLTKDPATSPATLEMAVWLKPGALTFPFTSTSDGGTNTWLCSYTDQWGQVWIARWLSRAGSSRTGYCIWYRADYGYLPVAQLDFPEMCRTAIDALAALGVRLDKDDGASAVVSRSNLYPTNLLNGIEPATNAGRNVVTRKKWIRALGNSPHADLGQVRHNLIPNGLDPDALLKGNYGWHIGALGGFAADGTLDFTNTSAFSSMYTYETLIVPGGTYRLTYTINSITGTLRPRLARADGGNAGAGTNFTDRSTTGRFTQDLTCPAGVTPLTLGFQSQTAGFSANISKVSLVRIA
jgi:hypothetical protein